MSVVACSDSVKGDEASEADTTDDSETTTESDTDIDTDTADREDDGCTSMAAGCAC